MTQTKQVLLGRFLCALTIDAEQTAYALGIQIAYDEVACGLRTTPEQFLKIAGSIERKLASDLGLRQKVEISDNRGLVSFELIATRDEAYQLIKIIRAMVDKLARERVNEEAKQRALHALACILPDDKATKQ